MKDETIGAYAFVTKDWRKLHYPLDLWLEHHLNIFDQISLCVYGNESIIPKEYRDNKKIKITSVNSYPSRAKFSFYVYGKTIAQKELQTDWKVLLDIDEFLTTKINTKMLDKRLAYPLTYHNLYKNLEYELVPTDFMKRIMNFVYVGKFIPNITYERIHFGDRSILGDGANVSLPYYVNKSLFTKIIFNLLKNNKNFNNFIHSYIENKKISEEKQILPFHLIHTTFLRPLAVLRRKLIEQTQREINEKFYYNRYLLDLFKKQDVQKLYENYSMLFPKTKLIKIDKSIIPNILLKNKKRFEIIDYK